MKNLFKPRSLGGLSSSAKNQSSCDELIKSALKGNCTSDLHGGDDGLSEVEPYFTDDETQGT